MHDSSLVVLEPTQDLYPLKITTLTLNVLAVTLHLNPTHTDGPLLLVLLIYS